MSSIVTRTLQWTVPKEPFMQYSWPAKGFSIHHHGCSRFAPTLRGRGWGWSRSVYIPPEIRQTDHRRFTFHILRSGVIHAARSPAVFFTRPPSHSLQQGSEPPGDTRYFTLVPSIFILDRDPFFSIHALPGGEVLGDQQVIFVFLAMNIPGYLCGSRMSMTLAPHFTSPLCPPDLGRLGRVLAHHHLLCIARCEIRMMKREPCKMW